MRRTSMKKAPGNGVGVTWFGHSAFRLTIAGGKTILIDPWLDNPLAPPGVKEEVAADLILITHGHSDHVGNAAEVADRTGATVIAIHELALYLKARGVSSVAGMNKGGTIERDGIRVTMVDARHSAGIDGDGATVPGGEAAAYVIRPERGPTFYHAGDTAVFGDMKLIARLYKPAVVMLPIGDLYTMGPVEAAFACAMLNPRIIFGMHYGTFPPLTGTPAALRTLLPSSLRSRVKELKPGVEMPV